MKLSDWMQLATFARDLGIALVCAFFSLGSIIKSLVDVRKYIQRRIFIHSENKAKKGTKK